MMIMMNFILDAYNNGGRSRFACRTVSKLGSRTKLKYSMDRERVGGGSRRNHQQQQRCIWVGGGVVGPAVVNSQSGSFT